MEKQPANSFEERISRMAEALKSEEMPGAPSHTMMSRAKTRRFPVRLLITLGSVAGVGLIFALASLPRQSAAAMLQRIVNSATGGLRHQIDYTLKPDGTWTVARENYADGLRYHSIPHGNETEQWIEGDRVYNLFRGHSYATVDTVHFKAAGKAWFYDNSLKHFFEINHPKWVKDAGQVQWRGMTLERFDTYCEGKDALDQTLGFNTFIYADLKTDRPYYEQTRISGDEKGQFQGGRTDAIEWEYPKDADLDLRLPQGTRLYDPEKMREQLKDQVTGNLGTDTVDGIKVTLRAVYASENGGIDVFTTGGTGRLDPDPAGLRIDGKETEGANGSGVNPQRWIGGDPAHGGKAAFEPLDYRGLKLVYQAAGFMQVTVPEEFDLEVPVWKPDGSKFGRHLAGYAKFPHVVPIRYAGTIVTGPRNEPILWGAKEVAAQKKFWDDTRKLYGSSGSSGSGTASDSTTTGGGRR